MKYELSQNKQNGVQKIERLRRDMKNVNYNSVSG